MDLAIASAPVFIGWMLGWLLLWRPRPLLASPANHPRPAIAIIIPARNEALALPDLLPPLIRGARAGDEIIVVDDHSTDTTAEVAAALGARVITPPSLPEGWLGKPHACWHGASLSSAPRLLFIDADVHPPEDLADRISMALDDHPESVVSVQPWHIPHRLDEHLSSMCNLTALMGVGRFSVLGGLVRPRVAFGPVLALQRDTYERSGGHAHPEVRARHTEDIGLARIVGASEIFTGPRDIAFRMYPGGLVDLMRGWTRSFATGATAAPWWAALATGAWVWSAASGWMVHWAWYAASALQIWVLARRAGRFGVLVAIGYPIALGVFVVIALRSAMAMALRREVTWKSRRIRAR